MKELLELQPIAGGLKTALERAAATYEADLSEQGLEWLSLRGITPGTALAARIGQVIAPQPGHERYTSRIAIPYIAADGTVTQIRYRCIEPHEHDGHGKYETPPGDHVRVYNPAAFLDPGDDLHICEGEFDALILGQCGYNAVAAPGVNSWKWRHTIGANAFPRVWLWGDGDEAGSKFNSLLQRDILNAAIVPIPKGQDVTDHYLQSGPEGLAALLQRAA